MFKEKNFDGEGHSKPTQEDLDDQKRCDEFFEKMANYHPPTYDHDEWYIKEIQPIMDDVAKRMAEKNVPFYMATLTAHDREDKSGAWRICRNGYVDVEALGEDKWMPPQAVVMAVGVENSVREMIGAAQNFIQHAMQKAIPDIFKKLFAQSTDSPAAGEENSPTKRQ